MALRGLFKNLRLALVDLIGAMGLWVSLVQAGTGPTEFTLRSSPPPEPRLSGRCHLKLCPMSHPMTPDALDQLARKRAGAKLGWYAHAIAFVLVNLVLFGLSNYAFGDRTWSVYPLLGWGLGLALHGVSVFVLGTGSGLRERMVHKERERLQREQERNGH